MVDVLAVLESRLAAAFDTLSPGADPVLRPSEHADFQANGALPLAKQLGRANPREVAAEIAASADLEGICSDVEISGPGFINLTLERAFLENQLAEMADDDHLGVAPASAPGRILVDYSAPNVAKEMHVGHLRTTCIGDSLCRVFGYLGHDVVRENHIGDWGTPFGMLIEHLIAIGEAAAAEELSVGDLTTFYQDARRSFDADEAFRDASRRRVVLLQSGDPETLRLWHLLVAESVSYFDRVYAELGVLLEDDDIVGESFYNPMLPGVVADLDKAGLLVESDGAMCVFPPGFTNREGDPLPLIVQKRDEGFGYAATDLAAIRDRVDRVHAKRICYVVDAGQSEHFAMCFAVARMAGWLPDDVRSEHVRFGIVLGTDHKRLRTRAGDSVKLVDLLDEAIERADLAVLGRSADLDATERGAIAKAVGIGAVKFADLSTDRERDYVFDFDRMLSFDGDTAPYLQYAHARIASILRRAEEARLAPGPIALAEDAERALGLSLLGFTEAVHAVADTTKPSRLAAYLLEVATRFTTFYERCPILRATDAATSASRLSLAALSARVLAVGLGLLGIEAPERM